MEREGTTLISKYVPWSVFYMKIFIVAGALENHIPLPHTHSVDRSIQRKREKTQRRIKRAAITEYYEGLYGISEHRWKNISPQTVNVPEWVWTAPNQ